MGALQPDISEEVVFRFFLHAFVLNAFKGEIPKTEFDSILTYVLLILPHSFMHYPPLDFINTPSSTTLNLVYMSCVFGFPAVWLLKYKTLYSSITGYTLTGSLAINYNLVIPPDITANIIEVFAPTNREDYTVSAPDSSSTNWHKRDFIITPVKEYKISESDRDTGPW